MYLTVIEHICHGTLFEETDKYCFLNPYILYLRDSEDGSQVDAASFDRAMADKATVRNRNAGASQNEAEFKTVDKSHADKCLEATFFRYAVLKAGQDSDPAVKNKLARISQKVWSYAEHQASYGFPGGEPSDSPLCDEGLYKDLLPLVDKACALDGAKQAENAAAKAHALKLAVLFGGDKGGKEQANRFLTKLAGHKNDAFFSKPLSEMLDFRIPEGKEWTPRKWKALAAQDPSVLKYLRVADKTEKLGDFPGLAKDVPFLAARFFYADGEKHPEFAAMAAMHGLSEKEFGDGLKVALQPKERHALPPFRIDGSDIESDGKDLGRYYMEQLAPNDLRGLFVGNITGCCTKFGGQGESCVRHARQSEDSCMYVWKQKTGGAIAPDDKIVAVSWAFMAKNNMLFFDGYGHTDSGRHKPLLQPFLEHFAYMLTDGRGAFNWPEEAPVVGARVAGPAGYAGVPKDMKQTCPEDEKSAGADCLPKDYEGYSDARNCRLVVSPVNHSKGRSSEEKENDRRILEEWQGKHFEIFSPSYLEEKKASATKHVEALARRRSFHEDMQR
jgi:hypothetical protein